MSLQWARVALGISIGELTGGSVGTHGADVWQPPRGERQRQSGDRFSHPSRARRHLAERPPPPASGHGLPLGLPHPRAAQSPGYTGQPTGFPALWSQTALLLPARPPATLGLQKGPQPPPGHLREPPPPPANTGSALTCRRRSFSSSRRRAKSLASFRSCRSFIFLCQEVRRGLSCTIWENLGAEGLVGSCAAPALSPAQSEPPPRSDPGQARTPLGLPAAS